MNKSIFVISQHQINIIHPAVYETVSAALVLQKITNSDVKIITIGNNISKLVNELSCNTGLECILIENPYASVYNCDIYKNMLLNFFSENEFSYILIPYTSSGFDYAPGLALKTNTKYISAIENIQTENNDLYFSRSACSGKVIMKIKGDNNPAVLTVMPGAFKKYQISDNRKGKITILNMPCKSETTLTTEISQEIKSDNSLRDAQTIVSAGRGIGKKDNLDLIYKLADIFPKSAIGCSRILADNGWLEYKHQIGITGQTVSPKLYLACGISGSAQHLQGMITSDFIVAINTDQNAPICNIADICINEDLTNFIPVFLNKYKSQYKD